MAVYNGGIRGGRTAEIGQMLFWKSILFLHRLHTKYYPRLLLSPLRTLLILTGKTSSYWRGELHHKLLQDKKSLGQNQPFFLTRWVAFGNPSSTTMHPLSWEAGGWKGLRRRSQMGKTLFSLSPHSYSTGWGYACSWFPAWPSSGIASAAELFPPAAGNLDYPAAFTSSTLLLVKWYSPGLKAAREAQPSSRLFMKNRFRQAKRSDLFSLLPVGQPRSAFSHEGSWLRCSTEPL